MNWKPIYLPQLHKPMRIIFFVSGTGGNLKAAIDLSHKEPDLLQVCLVISDRLGIKAIDIAENYNIPLIASDFEKECGIWLECKNNQKKIREYSDCAVNFHNRTLEKIQTIEKECGETFDLVVLSYHRWIHGDLFSYFRNRMINQHAGDLTVMQPKSPKERRYRGINPVLMALRAGEKRTRSCTFLINDGHDTGEVLCQGLWTVYKGATTITRKSAWKHELFQKQESDWPSLRFALKEIAKGNFGIAEKMHHPDGSRVIFFKGCALPYGGVDLEHYYA